MPVSNQQRTVSDQEELATGPQGIQGIRGEKGDTGPPGPQGKPGRDGNEGPRGPAGLEGRPGAKGERGTEGPIGPQGLPGVRGPRGDIGPPGVRGPEGQQGPASTTPGPKGDTGDAGPEGPQGEPGPPGEPGAQGPQGDTGPAGLPAYETAKAPDDQVSTSGRLQDIFGLSLEALPGTAYAFEFVIPYMGAITVKLEGPPSPDLLSYRTVDSDELVTMTGLLKTGEGGRLTARFRPSEAGTSVTILGGAMARWHTY